MRVSRPIHLKNFATFFSGRVLLRWLGLALVEVFCGVFVALPGVSRFRISHVV